MFTVTIDIIIWRNFRSLKSLEVKILLSILKYDFFLLIWIRLRNLSDLESLLDLNLLNNLNIIKYSLITGFFIGLYTVIDGYGARVSLSAISYMSWGFILSAMLFPILLKINKHDNIFRNIINDAKLFFELADLYHI